MFSLNPFSDGNFISDTLPKRNDFKECVVSVTICTHKYALFV